MHFELTARFHLSEVCHFYSIREYTDATNTARNRIINTYIKVEQICSPKILLIFSSYTPNRTAADSFTRFKFQTRFFAMARRTAKALNAFIHSVCSDFDPADQNALQDVLLDYFTEPVHRDSDDDSDIESDGLTKR